MRTLRAPLRFSSNSWTSKRGIATIYAEPGSNSRLVSTHSPRSSSKIRHQRSVSPTHSITPYSHLTRTRHYSSPSIPSTPGLLANKNAIITGASRGIGAAVAERFAKEGARCVLVGRDEAKLNDVLRRLEKTESGEHAVRIGDVGDGGFWRELSREVRWRATEWT